MIKIEKYETYGWKEAVRGMRNPMNSWDMSDSQIEKLYENQLELGERDLDLMKRLRNAGTDHRKFMRMISVYVDITAPLYWWKEFDTYKVGTTSNSCSTMHKIHAKEFTLDDFSYEHLTSTGIDLLGDTIDLLNDWRDWFVRWDEIHTVVTKEITCKKDCWWQMIQLLPSSYNQKRTILLNYEVLANMYKSRKNHKLDEWHTFCDWIKDLPYSFLITGEQND